MQINLSTLAKHYSDEGEAYKLVETMRWPNGPICPHCGETNNAYLMKATRKTRTGKLSDRRMWKCAKCRKQFSVTVGTIFHGSHVPLSKWLLAFYMLTASKNGVAAWEIKRTLGVTQKTAWFMMHRIREAMKLSPVAETMSGTIVADETFIGGLAKNKHNKERYAPKPYKPGHGAYPGKIAVLSLISDTTGEVRSQIVPNVTGASLHKAIAKHVDMAGSVLHTDAAQSYVSIASQFAGHYSVSHETGEYVRNGVSTNKAEGYFSQLKRSIDGTHHHVSEAHLPRYLAEFDVRYSTRKMTDEERFSLLMGQTGGRRLTYRSTTT